ncbi:MAG: hypothetical protein AAGJ40_04305 [Planctomycetota bacterium]
MSSTMTFQAYLYAADGRHFDCTLDQVAAAMHATAGMFFEWDGSFGWSGGADGWQITGTVYDNGNAVQYVDLHGRIERATGRQLMRDRLADLFSMLIQPPEDASDSKSIQGVGVQTTKGSVLTRFQEEISIMRLPDQQWQDLQALERELLG